MSAHHFSAAVDDIRDRSSVTGQNVLAESVPVRRPVSPENVCYNRHGLLKISQEFIKGFGKGLETLIGKVCVDGRGLRAFMSEKFLNHSQVDSSFQQMGRIGVP